MPQHIIRLLLLIVVFGVLAYAAKNFFTADSFYEYGHYRGKSIVEIAAEKPIPKARPIAPRAMRSRSQMVKWRPQQH